MNTGTIVLLVILAILVVLAIAFRQKVAAGWARLRQFYGEVMQEMKRVSWPTKDHVVNSTVVVGIATFFLMVVIGVVDWVFGQLVGLIFRV